MSWLRRNWFVFGLVAAVALAWAFPAAGARGGLLRTETTARIAVGVIFFLQGLTLASEALVRGVMRWRLHVLVQAWIFLLFPACGLLLTALAGEMVPPHLRLGFLFLCALPTTISTAVVFTTVAGGHVAGAIFNATLSNLLGIALTPLWTRWFMQAGGGAAPALGPVVEEIVLLLLVPVVGGQALRPWFGRWADAAQRRVAAVNSGIVLFIVYAAFAGSVQGGVWQQFGGSTTALAFGGVLVLFGGVTAAVFLTLRVSGLERGDRIAGLFCASQKTLAAGVPMAQLLFGGDPGLGLILLPAMLYHPVQLLVQGIMAGRLGAQTPPPAR